VLSSIFAKENGFDESLILNANNRICDASLSNVFWIKGDNIFTPPLREGGIAGVTRQYLLEQLPKRNYKVEEKTCEKEELSHADEIFLTNTIRGIRWVASFNHAKFGSSITIQIFNDVIGPLTQ
jgi:branched-chain amino acid aminotransferase